METEEAMEVEKLEWKWLPVAGAISSAREPTFALFR